MNKLGLSYTEVTTMSYFKIHSLLEGLKAVDAENNIMSLKIASNGLLLKSKDTAKHWSKLGDDLRSVYKEHGVKTVTTAPDLASLEILKSKLKRR